LAAVLLLVSTRLTDPRRNDSPEERDRGDVPGWVMITVMTAIVVIALLAVFREQVVTAVQNAFDSVSNAK
jgi:heme A synthase